ncbi:nitrous oxide reductase family maturation protein NosD [Pelistega sp. NLN82]|uniref:Nitrous oxide reductase family maturation protein NosD n=1 Tax=Pelistega ratti TaxID=2652177 RepID=A0A6L9Y8M4_9BURK|nr:nitrous oxide reductase family maturation protein NosD [Pelistega ratti]NEN76237.1 nitrous oxide reductase family maturation protein NosD [Pelistega ratti]
MRNVNFPKYILPSVILGSIASIASAEVIHVQPTDNLQLVIDQASSGDVLVLSSGTYQGQFVINKPLTLTGPEDRSAILEGQRQGRTLFVDAEDVVVRHLTVTQSGMNLPQMDAGIFLNNTATRALIEQNDLLDNLMGVYIWGTQDAIVQHNRIVGNNEFRVNERGNGVSVWNAPGSKVLENDISLGRDGIFSNNSSHNVFKGNTFTNLRYGVHYMYTNDSEVSENISVDNEIGYALMFSDRLKVTNNIAVRSKAQGIMVNYTNHSIIVGNQVARAEKCLFAYNANMNTIRNNYFRQCDMGIHYTAAGQGNHISGNAFVDNQNQVKYVGTRYMEWSHEQKGNYWSDNSAFDLNADGIADTAYRPNGIIDQVVWRAPAARLLLNSPAVSIVKWAQTQFPAILPGGIIDSYPLMGIPAEIDLRKIKELYE